MFLTIERMSTSNMGTFVPNPEQKECIQCEKETKHYIKENNMVFRCLSCGVIWRCKK